MNGIRWQKQIRLKDLLKGVSFEEMIKAMNKMKLGKAAEFSEYGNGK